MSENVAFSFHQMSPRDSARLCSSSNHRRARSLPAAAAGATALSGIVNAGFEEDVCSSASSRYKNAQDLVPSASVVGSCVRRGRLFHSEDKRSRSLRHVFRPPDSLVVVARPSASVGCFSRWKAVRRKNNGSPWWCRSPKPIVKRRRRRRGPSSGTDHGRQRDLNLIHLSGGEEGTAGSTSSQVGQATTCARRTNEGSEGHVATEVGVSSLRGPSNDNHGPAAAARGPSERTTEVVSGGEGRRRPPRSQFMARGETADPPPEPPPTERRGRGSSGHPGGRDRRPNQLDGFTHLDGTPRTDMLPDILNSHLPPPYSTLPPTERGARRLPPPAHPPPPPPPHLVPPLCNPITPCPPSPTRRSTRGCHPFPPRGRLRSSGRAGSIGGGHGSIEADEPKHCCGVMVTQTVSIRWFILMIAFVGLCCAIVGTVLGALKATGREHLTVSLLMIGVGIVLITVSGIAWRLTSHDAPSCRAMLGLQPTNQEPNRRFLPRVPPYGRPPHPYAAMLYPEFQYRPPPPSYQASMQEYRLRLLLLDRQHGAPSTSLSPVSPPPTYRSHASSTLHSSRPPLNFVERDYSRPPSYRSRASSVAVLRPNTDTMDSRQTLESRNTTDSRQRQTEGSGTQPGTPSHSRNPSLTLSFLSHESLFAGSGHSRPPDVPATNEHINPALFTSPSAESRTSVVAGLSDDSPIANHHSIERIYPPKWKADDSMVMRKNLDINTVTIVQTTDSSQVVNQDTVIVSITGQHPRMVPSENHEVQVLAQV